MYIIYIALGCNKIGLKNFSYTASGDSSVTLKWLEKDKVCSTLGRRAAIAFSLISATVGAHNTGTVFVAGSDNTLFDAMSRGWNTEETRNLNPHTNIPCPLGGPISSLLTLLDPNLPESNTTDTILFIRQISSLLTTIRLDNSGHDGQAEAN